MSDKPVSEPIAPQPDPDLPSEPAVRLGTQDLIELSPATAPTTTSLPPASTPTAAPPPAAPTAQKTYPATLRDPPTPAQVMAALTAEVRDAEAKGRLSGPGTEPAVIPPPSLDTPRAQVVRRGDRYFARDEGLPLGLWHNGERISGEHEFHPGDALSVGPLRDDEPDRSPLGQLMFWGATGLTVGVAVTLMLVQLARPGPSDPEPVPMLAPSAKEPIPPAVKEPEVAVPDLTRGTPTELPDTDEIRREKAARAAAATAASVDAGPAAKPLHPLGVLKVYEISGVAEAIKVARDVNAKELLEKLIALQNTMAALQHASDPAKQQTYLEQALAQDQAIDHGDGPLHAQLANRLGQHYLAQGQAAAAKKDMAAAKRAYEAALKLPPTQAEAKKRLAALDGK